MYHTLLSGCGKYLQGSGVLSQTGAQLKSLGFNHPFILGGKTALSVTMPQLKQALEAENIPFGVTHFCGHCTDKTTQDFSSDYKKAKCDCIIGIGGGKALDTSKAVANKVHAPIICIPTSAATCAATTPLSVMYSEAGKQIRIDFFKQEVNLVIVDTDIIVQAPVRLTASGIADSLAKFCEFASPYPFLKYGEKGTGLYCGYSLAQAANEILFQSGPQACSDIKARRLTQAVEDCVFVNIGLVGVISGLGGYGGEGKGRFAIAHALNEVMRIYYPEISSNWLHGEIVGVGVLAQLAVNKTDPTYIQKTRNLLQKISSPYSLQKLGFPVKSEELDNLISCLVDCNTLESEKQFLSNILTKMD